MSGRVRQVLLYLICFSTKDPDTSALQHHLEHLLELAYHMQDSYERQCEREAEHMVFDTAIAAFTETEQVMKSASRTMSIGSSSDLDSFVSATDVRISGLLS